LAHGPSEAVGTTAWQGHHFERGCLAPFIPIDAGDLTSVAAGRARTVVRVQWSGDWRDSAWVLPAFPILALALPLAVFALLNPEAAAWARRLSGLVLILTIGRMGGVPQEGTTECWRYFAPLIVALFRAVGARGTHLPRGRSVIRDHHHGHEHRGRLLAMSRFLEAIRRARRVGVLPERFRSADVRRACPSWADHTYGVFLPKHRRGNPGGYTEYFEQHDDGSFSLIR
jgi:hypothetical protein